MFTYLALNLLFLLSLVLFLPKKLSKPGKAFWLTLVVVLALTTIFDPIIIALDIVGYDTSKLLGIFIFGAPIEDFFYAFYAACIVPLIWIKLGERHVSDPRQTR